MCLKMQSVVLLGIADDFQSLTTKTSCDVPAHMLDWVTFKHGDSNILTLSHCVTELACSFLYGKCSLNFMTFNWKFKTPCSANAQRF